MSCPAFTHFGTDVQFTLFNSRLYVTPLQLRLLQLRLSQLRLSQLRLSQFAVYAAPPILIP